MEAESECQQCQPNLQQSEKFSVKISLVALGNRQGARRCCTLCFIAAKHNLKGLFHKFIQAPAHTASKSKPLYGTGFALIIV